MKPLFIPLKREYFEAFEDGSKDTEWRLGGPRWNVGTCFPGRPVVLSLGYGKARRLTGVIRHTVSVHDPVRYGIRGWTACYPAHPNGPAFGIVIQVTRTP